jgi:hypothetical protein
MTTPIDLDALEALCNAATQGPWKTENIPYRHDDGTTTDMWDAYCEYQGPGNGWYGVADNYDEPTARFVAESRTAIPALIAEVRRLHVQNLNLRAAIEQIMPRYVELFTAAGLGDPSGSIAVQLARDVLDLS